jgi:hypothetical protein
MVEAHRKKLTRTAIEDFLERVVDIEDQNFYRTFGLLDPSSPDLQGLATFFRKHGRHGPTLGTVSGEAWSASSSFESSPPRTSAVHAEERGTASRVWPRASLAPPLVIRWTYQAASKSAILVSDEVTYALGGKREYLVALDSAGRETFRSPTFAPYALWNAHLADDVVWLPAYVKHEDGSGSHDLWAISRNTGATTRAAEGGSQIATFVAPGRFLGRAYRPRNARVETVGLYAIGSSLEAVWTITVESNLKGGFGQALAARGDRMFVSHEDDLVSIELATGRELWRTDLSSLGNPWGTGNVLAVSVSSDVVLYGLQRGVVALRPETGIVIWTRSADAHLYRAHGVDALFMGGVTHFGGSETERVFLKLDPVSGSEEFRMVSGSPTWGAAPAPPPRFSTPPRPTDECVYIGDLDGRLWALSRDTGAPLWMQGLRGTGGLEQIVIAGDRMLVLDSSGLLTCLGQPSS